MVFVIVGLSTQVLYKNILKMLTQKHETMFYFFTGYQNYNLKII